MSALLACLCAVSDAEHLFKPHLQRTLDILGIAHLIIALRVLGCLAHSCVFRLAQASSRICGSVDPNLKLGIREGRCELDLRVFDLRLSSWPSQRQRDRWRVSWPPHRGARDSRIAWDIYVHNA